MSVQWAHTALSKAQISARNLFFPTSTPSFRVVFVNKKHKNQLMLKWIALTTAHQARLVQGQLLSSALTYPKKENSNPSDVLWFV
jgi:hypothetical protein